MPTLARGWLVGPTFVLVTTFAADIGVHAEGDVSSFRGPTGYAGIVAGNFDGTGIAYNEPHRLHHVQHLREAHPQAGTSLVAAAARSRASRALANTSAATAV